MEDGLEKLAAMVGKERRECQAASEHLQGKVQAMEKRIADSAYFLSSHDVASCSKVCVPE